jgi:hypothetical protein
MTTRQLPEDFPAVQAAIYGVALSLDSLLLNGIPYGVLHGAVIPGFLEKTADILLGDLKSLEEHVPDSPVSCQPKVREILAALRAKCHQLIDLLTGLISFRTLPLQQVQATVSGIPLLRGECVRLIQELEGLFQTPKPFYQSRPSHSTANVSGFLANLERMFEEERTTSQSA